MAEKTVEVHGFCGRCRLYINGYVKYSALITIEGDAYPLHVHYTMCCLLCGRILNLVSIDRESLKEEERITVKG
ncbi:MAG: hypothetical protein QW341_03605 [Candidatus Bathyarchaeia archaeon]